MVDLGEADEALLGKRGVCPSQGSQGAKPSAPLGREGFKEDEWFRSGHTRRPCGCSCALELEEDGPLAPDV